MPSKPAKSVPTKVRITADYQFTDEEMQGLGKDIAAAIRQKGEIENALKDIKNQKKAEINAVASRIAGLSSKINSGIESREMEACVTYDAKKRKKKYLHPQSGKLIREEDMAPSDFEPEFPEVSETMPRIEKPVPTPKKKAAPKGNLGEAIDKAAILKDAPLVTLDVSKFEATGALVTAFRKAAKSAAWSEAQSSLLIETSRKQGSFEGVRDVFAPHCQAKAPAEKE